MPNFASRFRSGMRQMAGGLGGPGLLSGGPALTGGRLPQRPSSSRLPGFESRPGDENLEMTSAVMPPSPSRRLSTPSPLDRASFSADAEEAYRMGGEGFPSRQVRPAEGPGRSTPGLARDPAPAPGGRPSRLRSGLRALWS